MRLRSDLLAARVPRYTSYPTAPHFNTGVGGATLAAWLRDLPAGQPLSLYFHIPFCDSLCWFCGCHTRVVNSYGPVAAYVDDLLRELALVTEAMGTRHSVSHIHFGGGSPTILRADDIARITDRLRERFDIARDAAFAVEIDPRGLQDDTVAAFAKAGVTRASIGVQDVNPLVQRAVNRLQSWHVTRDAVARLRDAGIAALNIDLMYGLPQQSVDDLRRTVELAVTLKPQRLAVFGYAHVPEMKRHQGLINGASLPGASERLRQYDAANDALIGAGYTAIGLDHFALADDPLAAAQRAGRLKRNFQGYTTDDADSLVGFGVSAISSLPQGYAQNTTDAPGYRARVAVGELATARGRTLTGDDRVRRAIIERLMCDLSVDVAAVATAHGLPGDAFAAEIEVLAPLAADGCVAIEGSRVTVPENMRAAVRLVCAAFDAYLAPHPARHAVAV
jgi:oxygen-independent coproporphyrinogen-3 oxidase